MSNGNHRWPPSKVEAALITIYLAALILTSNWFALFATAVGVAIGIGIMQQVMRR